MGPVQVICGLPIAVMLYLGLACRVNFFYRKVTFRTLPSPKLKIAAVANKFVPYFVP